MTTLTRLQQIHPFPARMAPELALEALHRMPKGSVVLDPMCGSGTVLKHAAEEGHRAVGFDLDPLAVLMSRVACRSTDPGKTIGSAERLVALAEEAPLRVLPWMNEETASFAEFWFADSQRSQLNRLAGALAGRSGAMADLFRVALSRTIITKDRGASLARDVSHSRPHRVRTDNDFDVFKGFLLSVKAIAGLIARPVAGDAVIRRGDARSLPRRLNGQVDLVVTSPPYLNAIDYMRGHRMSLVWLGHELGDLRKIRSEAIGAERALDHDCQIAAELAPRLAGLADRHRTMLERYAHDVHLFMYGVAQKLSATGQAVVVVGDSTLRGTYIENSAIVARAAALVGLRMLEQRSRDLPANSRYLPPPAAADNPMSKRMRSEVVFHFAK